MSKSLDINALENRIAELEDDRDFWIHEYAKSKKTVANLLHEIVKKDILIEKIKAVVRK